MAKCYKLDKINSNNGGRKWYWYCTNNPNENGFEISKKIAKERAKNKCGTDCGIVIAPVFNFKYTLGSFDYLNTYDIDGNLGRFTSDDISEEQFQYFTGISEPLEEVTEEDKVIVTLKALGIYRGGTTRAEIENLHNLTPSDFDRLVDKDYAEGTFTIEDDDSYTWNII